MVTAVSISESSLIHHQVFFLVFLSSTLVVADKNIFTTNGTSKWKKQLMSVEMDVLFIL